MFRLSKAAEYAIRGVFHLSTKGPGKRIGVEEIAERQNVPAFYLAKLFQGLVRKGFVKSFRGADGGFTLSMDPGDITLLQIIESVEGPIYLNDCLLRDGVCSRQYSCPVHDVWSEAQKRFLEHLKKITFKDLVKSAESKASGGGVLKRPLDKDRSPFEPES